MDIINRHDMVKKIVKYLESDKIVVSGKKHSYKRKYHLNYSQRIVDDVLTALLETMAEEVENGNTIYFQNYFSLKPVMYKEKKGRNVISGEEVIIPAGYRLKFNPRKLFKQACEKFNDNIMNEE